MAIVTDGFTQATPNGYQQINPMLAIANKAWEQMLKSAAMMGMSPSERSRIIAKDEGEKKVSKMQTLLNGTRRA